jgi:hypothetical protein
VICRRAWIAIVAVALVGCYRDFRLEPAPRPDAGAAAIDAGAPGSPDAGWTEPIGVCADPTPVDLLFVIDDSASMGEEQAALAAQLPALIEALVEPPDVDGDGAPDWLPIPELRVAVITTDMGSGGHMVPTCTDGTFGARFGDDGILRTEGNVTLAGCAATYLSVFQFAPGATAGSTEVACVTTAGTGGCGFEQPLEAALKALSPSRPASYTSPSYVPPIFHEGTAGHGDGANAGFVRDDALLAVVIVTDEEDCSLRVPDVLDPSSTTYRSPLGLRCFMYPETLHPVERYVDGLVALRARQPDLLALAVIAGVPADAAVAIPDAEDLVAMLAHPDMQERLDPADPSRLVPACESPARGLAFPAPRLVRVAAGLGEGRATVQSICEDDLRPATDAVVELVVRRACRAREVL